ncbi:MAG: sugar transferase [Candidatus Omnitrophica bacterium]|nr:sugar transferase [Candidatus Omnitrophota bacterium]
MIKERENFLRKIIMLADSIFIAGAYIVACYVESLPYAVEQYLWPLFIIVPVWINIFIYLGLYKSFRIRGIIDAMGLVVKGSLLASLFFISAAYILRIPYLTREFLIAFLALAICLLLFEKLTIIGVSRYIRRKGYNYRRILIVGTGLRAERFINLINKHPQWGLRVMKIIDNDPARLNMEVCGIKVTGLLKDMTEILHAEVIDEVVYIVPRSWLSKIEKSIIQCELEGIRTHIAMDLYDLKIAKGTFASLGGFPLVSFNTIFIRQEELFLKRLFDIIFSLLVLVMSSPLFLLVAVVIKRTSPGPVLFKQERTGLNGRKFIMLKFRSMVVGAEEIKDRLEALNEMRGPIFKIKKDPRFTPIGRFLRRTSIDELPQFINVLKGDMSVVGPRPPIQEEVEKYEDWQRRRLSMKPGITCIWQVSGRSMLDFDKWMELDLEYIDNWSLWMDLKLLLKTIPVVFSGSGAM